MLQQHIRIHLTNTRHTTCWVGDMTNPWPSRYSAYHIIIVLHGAEQVHNLHSHQHDLTKTYWNIAASGRSISGDADIISH